MSCLATNYASCPVPTNYFVGAVPTITITRECCTDAGTTYAFQVDGINDLGGTELWIDGSLRNCADPTAYSPCFTDDLLGSLAITGYTIGGIGPGNIFSINGTYTIPACGTCITESTALRIFITGDAVSADLCCYVDVPINISIADDAPFTLSTAAIVQNANVGFCDADSFTITNDSCLTRRYSVVLGGCPAGLVLSTSVLILASGATSSGITITYCPTLVESGACTVTITSIAIAAEDPCGTEQVIDIQYRSFNTEPLCSDCNIVSIDGVPQPTTCDPICANVGDEICVKKNIQFPVREFVVVGADNVLNTFTILGEWAGFSVGLSIEILNSTCNDGTYLIASTSYDSVLNQTTIFVTAAVPCATADGTLFVDTEKVDCLAFATLVITNTVTGEEITNTTYNPVGGFVYLNFCFTIVNFGSYSVSLTWGDCFDTLDCTIEINACQQYTIVKTACHEYLITDSNSATGKIDTIIVANFSGSYNQTYTLDLSQGNTLAITLPSDDVYTVTITDNLTSNVFTDVIYDFCDLITCYRKLILDLFCNEKDPCCKECNQKQLAELQFKRDELNKLNALAGTLFAYIHRDKITHMGIFTIDECRVTDIQMIMDISDKIKEILERCGECGKTTTTTTTPCTTC